MGGKINMDELPDEVLEKLGLKDKGNGKAPPKLVKPQIIALGVVLQGLRGLGNREALWVLRTASILVRGYRKDKEAKLGKERKFNKLLNFSD